jgi:hypothetical protein
MRSLAPSLLSCGLLVLLACGTAYDEALPATPDGGAPGADAGAVTPPDGCDPAADPRDAPKCVANDFAVFVDATSGSDTNPGTKESPTRSITAALGKLGLRSRVYVCAGEYTETIDLKQPASIFGGFACGAFTYSGIKPTVRAPSGNAYALDVHAGDLRLADLALLGPELGTPSSIAARVVRSSGVTLLRMRLEGGVAAKGANGTRSDVSFPATSLKGMPALGPIGGAARVVSCPGGAMTTGGKGGDNGSGGNPGLPAGPGSTGGAGTGGAVNASCAAGGAGGDGGRGGAGSPGPGASTLGAIVQDAWIATNGGSGSIGSPGQGGGGGSGMAGAGGGGGGAGSCGGAGGGGGGGGGASVALLSVDSTITIVGSELRTAGAGDGGTGSAGQPAQANPGPAGLGAPGACSGGNGGLGGDGGDGGGGAGGVSIGVLYKGSKPILQTTTVSPGAAGAGGSADTVRMGSGIAGTSAETLAL